MITQKKILDFFKQNDTQTTTCNPRNAVLESFIRHEQSDFVNNDNKEQQEDEEKSTSSKLFVFTDGSQIRKHNTRESLAVAWAYVLKTRDRTTLRSHTQALRPSDTNQRAELMAIYQALSWVTETSLYEKFDEIQVCTDSEYSMKSLTLWSLSWVKNQWKNSQNQPVKNTDIIKPTLEVMNKLKQYGVQVHIRHVKAHTDRMDFFADGNREVDRLAHECAKNHITKKNKS